MPGLSLDPRARLGLLAAAGVLALALSQPLSLGLLALATAAPLLALRIEGRWLWRGALALAAVIWSTVLSQGLFYSDQPRVLLFSLGPLSVWREGVTHGLVQSLRFVALTLGGLALSLSTSPERLFAGLLALRVPFGVAFLAVTAVRAVPEIGREWWVVRQARARRGRPLWQRPPWAWVRAEVALLTPVVARSLRRARALAESLDARGFDPLAPRAQYRPLRLQVSDVALLGTAWGLALSAAALRLLYLAYTAELLYVPALRPVYGFVRRWM